MYPRLTAVIAAALLALPMLASAADMPAPMEKKPTAQQSKMATCNKSAEGKKGDERKAFMKECLTAKKETSQQSKMSTCSKDAAAKKLSGDERKKYMSDCLKA